MLIMPSKTTFVGPNRKSVAGEASSKIVSMTRSTEATALVVRGAHLVDLTMLNKSVQRESHPRPQLNYSPFTSAMVRPHVMTN